MAQAPGRHGGDSPSNRNSDPSSGASAAGFRPLVSQHGAAAPAHGSVPPGHAPADKYGFRPAPDLTKSEEIIRVRKKRKKPHKGRKAVLIALGALVVVFGLVGGAVALYISSLDQALSFHDQNEEDQLRAVLANSPADTKAQPFYMLLLGSDAREGDTASRSDVMILLRIDPTSGQLTMVSIPRDLMVDLPGHGRSKINAAYAYDGAAGAVQAVSKFADVPISHYAEIHFQELENLVDTLGGVWVNVPVSNDQTGSSNTGMHLNAGEQLLNGEQALALARERYGYERGDFQRADNQKLILQAIIKQTLAVSPVDLPSIIQQLAGCVATDYSVTDIISLAQTFQKADNFKIYSTTVPSYTMTIDGVSYVAADQQAWSQMKKRVDMGADPNAETVASPDAADEDVTATNEGNSQ